MRPRRFPRRRAVLGGALLLLFLTPLIRTKASGLGPGAPAPELRGGPWIHSAPLRLADLRGKVVLLEMWTFG